MRWFHKDYNGDALVEAMTDDQDLAYRRLLEASWELGPLPDDVESLAKLVRFRQGDPVERFRAAWTYPLTACWHHTNVGGLINHKLEDEREMVLKRSKKAREAVRERWKKQRKRLGIKGKPRDTNVYSEYYVRNTKTRDPDPDPDPEDLTNRGQPDLRQLAANKISTDAEAVGRNEGSNGTDKALWVEGKLVIDEDWLRKELEQFYRDADSASPESEHPRLTKALYRKGRDKLVSELLVHPERRAVPTSKPPKKRGFATYVSRHFKRLMISEWFRQSPAARDRIAKEPKSYETIRKVFGKKAAGEVISVDFTRR